LSLTYPHKENSKGVKSGKRSGQAIVPPRLTVIGLSKLTVRISGQLCTRGMPSDRLNENLRSRRSFRSLPDQIVTSVSDVKTAEFLYN